MKIKKKFYVDPTQPDSTFSHIGQDIKKLDSTCQTMYKSTIKEDYPSFGYIAKQSRVLSPKQADFLSAEVPINELKSLTATHFVKQGLSERTALSDVAKLAFGTKNLMKMDADNRAICFDTTHKIYFPARVLEKVKGKDDMMISNIPQGRLLNYFLFVFLFFVYTTLINCFIISSSSFDLNSRILHAYYFYLLFQIFNSKSEICRRNKFNCLGDKEMVRLPLSHYEENFQDRQLSKLDVAIPAQFKTPPVLRGDTRSYKDQFETTNSLIFGGHCTLPQKLQPIKVMK